MDVIVSGRLYGAIATNTPNALLAAMKARMRQDEAKGKIRTWSCDAQGDFSYLAEQYKNIAWVRPILEKNSIDLKLVWPDGKEPADEIKAILMGRFIEMVLVHFTQADFIDAKGFPVR